MRVERHDGTRARKVLVGMVVSKDVLARLAPLWDGELFPSPWENLVAGWCVDHFVRYASAPKADIAARFEAWSESADKATKDLVGRFLQELDGEYRRLAKSVNAEYLVDLAGDLFNRTRLERTLDKAKADLAAGDVRKAQARLLKQTPVEVGAGSVIDVLQSDALVSQTFTAKQAPLFTYPDAAGMFFNQSLERDGFLAVMAPAKSGKTFWLLDLAWVAMEQRRRVLFFQCGDLSATQMTKRFLERAARHPMQAESWPHVTRYPRKVSNHGDGGLEIEWKEKTFTAPLTEVAGREAFRLVQSEVLKSDESYLKMSVHANSSLSTAGIRSIVQAYDAQGWTPDLVVVDYADILANPPGYSESRDAVNHNWKDLRRLSQEYHCLVVTGTQTNAASFDTELLSRKHFSEDRRKFDHVTGMFGLNVGKDDRRQQLTKVNWVIPPRERDWKDQVLYAVACLDYAMPCVRSTF